MSKTEKVAARRNAGRHAGRRTVAPAPPPEPHIRRLEQLTHETFEHFGLLASTLGVAPGEQFHALLNVLVRECHFRLAGGPARQSEAETDAFTTEAARRLYDAYWSMADWQERKTPWRFQSSEMRKGPAPSDRVEAYDTRAQRG